MTATPRKPLTLRQVVKIAAAVGALLGLLCSSLPVEYQAICHTVSSILVSC